MPKKRVKKRARRRLNGTSKPRPKHQGKAVEQKQEVASLDEVRPDTPDSANVALHIDMPLITARALNSLSQRIGAQGPADTISRGLMLLHQLEAKARQGEERVTVAWNNGSPEVSVILVAR